MAVLPQPAGKLQPSAAPSVFGLVTVKPPGTAPPACFCPAICGLAAVPCELLGNPGGLNHGSLFWVP